MIWVPSVVLVETIYLVGKARFPSSLITQMLNLVDPPSANYPIVSLDVGVIRALQTVDRAQVPELPDRIIAASAKYLGLPLLSKDSVMTVVIGLSVIW